MSQDFRNKVVVVTGASAGVGRAAAIEFGRRGATVALIARGSRGLEGVRADVERAGGRALTLQLDVADAAAVDAAAERVEREFGPIDVWVNNAMVTVFSPIAELEADEVKRVTEVTYLGFVHGTLAALRYMRTRDRGTIVQVGSALAYRSIPLQAAYCAAKAAVRGFTDSLHCELRHDGSHVRLTTVHMPALNTPQFGWVHSRMPNEAQPVPPIFEPEVAARAIVYAAAHPRRELWVGGSTFLAILSSRIAPGIGDWYLGRTGYKSQQRATAQPADAPDNLWNAMDQDIDHGAHGDFDNRATGHSWALRMSLHRRSIGVGAAGMALATAAGVAAVRKR